MKYYCISAKEISRHISVFLLRFVACALNLEFFNELFSMRLTT
jgi:hypothetical protein